MKDAPQKVDIRCPKCHTLDLQLIEVMERLETVPVIAGQISLQQRFRSEERVAKVLGRCMACDHEWQVRKAATIEELCLPSEDSPPEADPKQDYEPLPGWTVMSAAYRDGAYRIEAAPEFETRACRVCGSEDTYLDGFREQSLMDAPMRGRPVVVRARVRRISCRHCQRRTNQAIPGMDEHHRMTKRCLAYIFAQLSNPGARYTEIAKQVGCHEKTIRLIAENDVFPGEVF